MGGGTGQTPFIEPEEYIEGGENMINQFNLNHPSSDNLNQTENRRQYTNSNAHSEIGIKINTNIGNKQPWNVLSSGFTPGATIQQQQHGSMSYGQAIDGTNQQYKQQQQQQFNDNDGISMNHLRKDSDSKRSHTESMYNTEGVRMSIVAGDTQNNTNITMGEIGGVTDTRDARGGGGMASIDEVNSEAASDIFVVNNMETRDFATPGNNMNTPGNDGNININQSKKNNNINSNSYLNIQENDDRKVTISGYTPELPEET